MVRIRLVRAGRKNLPFFRVVAAEAKTKVNGKFIEKLGYYDPIKKVISINLDSVKKWKEKGAQFTASVIKLIKQHQKTK